MRDRGTSPDLGGASRGGGTVDGSLYERLGGVDAITAVVRAVVDRQMKDDRILFGALIGAGNNPSRLFVGYAIGGALMIVGGIVELLLGVAERKELEQIACPLTAV